MLSINSAGTAEQLKGTNSRSERRLSRCMARAISSLPVPDSPVTSTVESESFMRSTLFATSDIARLLNTIPGNKLAATGIGITLLACGPDELAFGCERARKATSLSALSSLACSEVKGRTHLPYNAAPSRADDGTARSTQIDSSPCVAGTGRPLLEINLPISASPSAISLSSRPSAHRKLGLPVIEVAQMDNP